MVGRLLVVVALGLCAAAGRAAGAEDPLVGTFSGEGLSVSVTAVAKGYAGMITMGSGPAQKAYPFRAQAKAGAGGAMAGQFSDPARSFPFSATLEGADTLVLQTGATTYRLARHGGARTVEAIAREGGGLPPVEPSVIDGAIRRAKAYLYAQQADGNWDLPQRIPEPKKLERSLLEIQNSTQWGGVTALATYTLLAAGENPQEGKVAPAIEWLKKAEVDGTYALGCRLLVWNAMPSAARRGVLELAKRDRDLLLKNKRTSGAVKGLFRYLPEGEDADFSASQFAVLGLWSAEQLGAEVPASFWGEAQAAWLAGQQADGGWPYSNYFAGYRSVTPSMTAAGVATLFITGDMLGIGRGGECRGNLSSKAIDAGVNWINEHADEFFLENNKFPYYSLYGLERIGLASGLKYIGSFDWYRRGAAALLADQNPDGSWGAGVADTCFGVLFLVRGRAPVVMSKLQYGFDLRGDKPRAANWNQRPRDAANVTRWIGRQLERELQWQVVNLSGPAEDLHDAPILYVAGNQQLLLSDADEAKLQAFVRQGGLIVGNADCVNPAFATSFKKLGTKLFPPYEFRELPAGHVVYGNLYQRSKWRVPPQVQGLSNGVRELMILLPAADPARFWQTGAAAGHEAAFELMANLFVYCSEGRVLRQRGESWVVTPRANVTTTRTVRLARLRHEFNWDPEPGGWMRLAAMMHNEDKVELAVETMTLGEGKLAAGGHKLAHLTTTGRVKLKDEQRAELKKFVEGGGTLLVDAAGGDAEGAAGLEGEIALMTGGKLEMLAAEDPVYAHLGVPVEQITYRAYAAKRSVGRLSGPRLRGVKVGGRTAVIYSAEDLSAGLVGQPVDGVYGYTPASAGAIVRSVVLGVPGEN